MSRYIDADKLKKAWYKKHNITEEDCGACFVGYSELPRLIDNAPTADVRENVRGEWLSKNLDNFRKYEVICSVCGARFIGNYDAYDEPYDFNFCPNCGADMREQEQ